MSYKKMNPKAKSRWISALRSGRYKQGRDVLRRKTVDPGNYKYCCLGVLANTQKVKWIPYCYDSPIVEGAYSFFDNELSGELSQQFLERVELSKKAQQTLIDLNDFKQLNFKQIADWIEKNL